MTAKRIIFIVLLIGAVFSSGAQAKREVLNLYNWSGYLPDALIQQFEKETGIHVTYSTYDSNETMYAKMKANPDAGYDLVLPSTYFVDRMRRQGMLLKIDKTRLTNFKNLNPELLNKSFDPGNLYSVPYSWGTTGIALNTKFYGKNSIKKWNDFWRPEYRDQLMILDDTREVFSMAMLTLGYSVNDSDQDHIKEAFEKLQKLLPNIKLFNSEAEQAIYIDEDATLGMGWSGDILMAKKENPSIEYIYPKEGFVVWLDSLVIPAGSKHIDNVYKFIDFLLRPEIAKQISLSTGYATANLAGVKLLPKEIQQNTVIYPDAEILRRGQYQQDLGSISSTYERYMELLKIAD